MLPKVTQAPCVPRTRTPSPGCVFTHPASRISHPAHDGANSVSGLARAPGGSDEAEDTGGFSRPGTPARTREGAGRADPARRRGVVHLLGPARLGQDDPRPADREP